MNAPTPSPQKSAGNPIVITGSGVSPGPMSRIRGLVPSRCALDVKDHFKGNSRASRFRSARGEGGHPKHVPYAELGTTSYKRAWHFLMGVLRWGFVSIAPIRSLVTATGSRNRPPRRLGNVNKSAIGDPVCQPTRHEHLARFPELVIAQYRIVGNGAFAGCCQRSLKATETRGKPIPSFDGSVAAAEALQLSRLAHAAGRAVSPRPSLNAD
jgi:hypothetical protein